MKQRILIPAFFIFLIGAAWITGTGITTGYPGDLDTVVHSENLMVLATPSAETGFRTPLPGSGMNVPGLLTPPATVYPPTQADDGAQVFFYICLVCHGDRGQGLTEWRKNLTPPDNNCWQSKCHAPNHMEGSFTFPREVPPVVGPGVLLGFQNALNLHDYIRTKMPWQAPGSLKEEQYWQLTAYLIRANGVDPGLQPLNAANAAKLSFIKPTPAAQTQGTAGILGALILAALGVVGAVVLIRRLARKGGNGSSRDSS